MKLLVLFKQKILDVWSNCLLVLGSQNCMNRTFFGVGTSRFFTRDEEKNTIFTQKISSTNKKGDYGTN